MLSKLNNWFNKHLSVDETSPAHNVELATAVLLHEIMRADHKLESQELVAFRQQLEQQFSLSNIELDELCLLSQEQAEAATDFHQFTRIINDKCDPQQKQKIMEGLWAVAYADHELSADEEYTIRKIADLLYVPHSQYIKSKLAAQPSKPSL
jgi:uncharacterized tellurite resistance protein B-like protein